MSSRSGVKIFAQFFGMSQAAYRELGPDLSRLDDVEYDGGKVEVVHAGRLPQLPALMERVRGLMAEGKKGYVDVIDHDAGQLSRHVITKEGVETTVRSLDDVVQPYSYSG
ncbi:MAG: hypothetical protein AB1916_00320 [Thermodesulfobacteriota bacterium]